MVNRLLKIGIDYFLTPIAQALLFGISVYILSSMIMAPLALYWGAVDGLWNYERSVFVAIGLPALTLLIFNFYKIKKSVLVKVWRYYFSIGAVTSHGNENVL